MYEYGTLLFLALQRLPEAFPAKLWLIVNLQIPIAHRFYCFLGVPSSDKGCYLPPGASAQEAQIEDRHCPAVGDRFDPRPDTTLLGAEYDLLQPLHFFCQGA